MYTCTYRSLALRGVFMWCAYTSLVLHMLLIVVMNDETRLCAEMFRLRSYTVVDVCVHSIHIKIGYSTRSTFLLKLKCNLYLHLFVGVPDRTSIHSHLTLDGSS